MKKTESNEFAMRLIPSVMSILLCLGLLCTTSLAYFTDTVTSRSNVIASASYWLEVEDVTPQSTAAEPSMIMADFAGEETTAQTPAVEEEYNAGEGESGVAPAAESDIPEVNAQTGITTTISTASSSKNSNALHDEESYEVVDAGISADAVSILTASLTEEEAAEDGGAGSKPITFNYGVAGLYYFKITAHGTAQNGYCKISIGDKSYYTTRIEPGSESSITLCIAVDANSTIKFTAQWGTSAYYANEGSQEPFYGANSTIVACSDELYKALLEASANETDETDDDETGDDETGDDETGNDETGDDETGNDETGDDETDETSGENQGGGDDILTVDAAA